MDDYLHLYRVFFWKPSLWGFELTCTYLHIYIYISGSLIAPGYRKFGLIYTHLHIYIYMSRATWLGYWEFEFDLHIFAYLYLYIKDLLVLDTESLSWRVHICISIFIYQSLIYKWRTWEHISTSTKPLATRSYPGNQHMCVIGGGSANGGIKKIYIVHGSTNRIRRFMTFYTLNVIFLVGFPSF
jgi:hypothetical protein